MVLSVQDNRYLTLVRQVFLTFWDREGGGGGGRALEVPLCNFKTVNAMVTKLTQDDVDSNYSNLRCFVDMLT